MKSLIKEKYYLLSSKPHLGYALDSVPWYNIMVFLKNHLFHIIRVPIMHSVKGELDERFGL